MPKQKDAADLARLEATARKGFKGWSQTLLALQEIHERELYRLVCDDWREYLKQRFAAWGQRRRVDQLIAAVGVFLGICDAGTVVPSSERQTRPLTGLPATIQKAIWEEATADGSEPAAARVQELADKWRDEQLAEIQAEEERRLAAQKNTPARPPRALVERIDELLGRVEKLCRKLDLAAGGQDLDDLAGRLERLAATLREGGVYPRAA